MNKDVTEIRTITGKSCNRGNPAEILPCLERRQPTGQEPDLPPSAGRVPWAPLPTEDGGGGEDRGAGPKLSAPRPVCPWLPGLHLSGLWEARGQEPGGTEALGAPGRGRRGSRGCQASTSPLSDGRMDRRAKALPGAAGRGQGKTGSGALPSLSSPRPVPSPSLLPPPFSGRPVPASIQGSLLPRKDPPSAFKRGQKAVSKTHIQNKKALLETAEAKTRRSPSSGERLQAAVSQRLCSVEPRFLQTLSHRQLRSRPHPGDSQGTTGDPRCLPRRPAQGRGSVEHGEVWGGLRPRPQDLAGRPLLTGLPGPQGRCSGGGPAGAPGETPERRAGARGPC